MMKVIKIGAVWCSGCLVMNGVMNKIFKNYSFSYEEYDVDFDCEIVSKYQVGDVLPLFIIMNGDREVSRFAGEYSYDEMVKRLKKEGVIDD